MLQQRYITGVEVFDTVTGLTGVIVQMNLMNPPVSNPYTVLYSGAWFVVQLRDSSLQMFTDAGRRIDHTTGEQTAGITLLTQKEYNGAMAQGYPQS